MAWFFQILFIHYFKPKTYQMKTLNMAAPRSIFKKISLSLFALLLCTLTFAQDKKVDVNINTNGGGGGFFASPWVWVVGVAVFILLLVALMRGGGRRSDV
jgi:hypothetical protein